MGVHKDILYKHAGPTRVLLGGEKQSCRVRNKEKKEESRKVVAQGSEEESDVSFM